MGTNPNVLRLVFGILRLVFGILRWFSWFWIWFSGFWDWFSGFWGGFQDFETGFRDMETGFRDFETVFRRKSQRTRHVIDSKRHGYTWTEESFKVTVCKRGNLVLNLEFHRKPVQRSRPMGMSQHTVQCHLARYIACCCFGRSVPRCQWLCADGCVVCACSSDVPLLTS